MFDTNHYINNGIVHDLVDQLIVNNNLDYQVIFDSSGRKWTYGNNIYDDTTINSSQRGIISQLFALVYVKVMSLISSDFCVKFADALQIINSKNKWDADPKNAENAAKQVLIQETTDRLRELRSNVKNLNAELEAINEELNQIDNPLNLKGNEELESLVELYKSKQKVIEELKKVHEQAKTYLEDKLDDNVLSFHFETVFKKVDDLKDEELKALLDLDTAEKELKQIFVQIKAELRKFRVGDKEEVLTRLRDRCAEKEREIIELGGTVPSEYIDVENHDEFLFHNDVRQVQNSNHPVKISNIDKAFQEIQEQTGSIPLAKVWALLLGKFEKKFGNIVKSVNVNGQKITLNLGPMQGQKKAVEQYRMWFPLPPNVTEPVGGILIMLGSEIILNASPNCVKIEKGFKNCVRNPKSRFPKYIYPETTLMKQYPNDCIGITLKLFGFSNELPPMDQDGLYDNWGRGIVITDNQENEKIIESHKNDYQY